MALLEKLFGFDHQKHKIKTEVMAGVTTFLTIAYILAVNPSIFANLAGMGMDTNAVFTSTALAAVIGTMIMAIYAKKPFGLAPGMGLNAFFVFTVCLTMGYSWQFALTAILIEGITSFTGIVDTPPSISPLFCQFEFHNILSFDMLVVVFTFLFVDMFDTMGTLVGVCTKAGMMRPDGRISGLNKAFMADAIATISGACIGASTTTTYVESASGVALGGRTGLTAFSTAVLLHHSVVLCSGLPFHSCSSHHPCVAHRRFVYDVANQGQQPQRLCRVDTCIHHHHHDAFGL